MIKLEKTPDEEQEPVQEMKQPALQKVSPYLYNSRPGLIKLPPL